jgi:hypothetical protein
MTTLFLAWQGPQSRRWFPVGRLDADLDSDPARYRFSYIEGARGARELAEFLTVPGFPVIETPYQSERLFPFFQNRLMNSRRPERPEYLHQLGLDPDHWDPVSELAAPFNQAHKNGYEVFPDVVPDADGRFGTRFVVHGLRYTNEHSIERAGALAIGEELRLSLELNNPATGHAVTVKTADQYVIGWLPRYLVDVVYRDGGWLVEEPEARVAQLNSTGSLRSRVLVEFTGRLPLSMRSMDCLPQYRSIIHKNHPPASHAQNALAGR